MPRESLLTEQARENPASDLIGLLARPAPRLAMAFAAGQAAWPSVKWVRAKVQAQRQYTVKVVGSDEIYDRVHDWVLTLLPPARRRALIAYTAMAQYGSKALRAIDPDDDDEDWALGHEPGTEAGGRCLGLRYDGSRQQVIVVRGHKIKVAVHEDGRLADGKEGAALKPPEICFTASSERGREAVLAEIAMILQRSRTTDRKPSFYLAGSWGGWERIHELPARPLESVILPEDQRERLVADLGAFLRAESEYVRRGIPWHRGYLLEGRPRTGKTSIARALAGHFGMDVWFLSPNDIRKDGDLMRMISRVTPRSMLVIEDADVFGAAKERVQEDDGGDGVTVSGLLNCLDGMATPHGLVTVMTSNFPERLDDALVQPGRVDVREYFGLAGPVQAARLLAYYYSREPLSTLLVNNLPPLSPAAIIEACKRSSSPEEAVASLERDHALA